MRDRMSYARIALGVVVLITLLLPALASARPGKQYVLKNPKQEECRANFVRAILKVKVRRNGKVITIRKPGCTYVKPPSTTPSSPPLPPSASPPPASPAPGPPIPPPPTPAPTITKMKATSVACHAVSLGEECIYNLASSVETTSGTLLPSAEADFVFTNPGAPGEVWGIESNKATIFVGITRFQDLRSTYLGDSTEGVVAEADGENLWEVYAIFPGSALYIGSQSATQNLIW